MGTIKQIDGMDGSICTICLFFLGEMFFANFRFKSLVFAKDTCRRLTVMQYSTKIMWHTGVSLLKKGLLWE